MINAVVFLISMISCCNGIIRLLVLRKVAKRTGLKKKFRGSIEIYSGLLFVLLSFANIAEKRLSVQSYIQSSMIQILSGVVKYQGEGEGVFGLCWDVQTLTLFKTVF